MPLKKCPKCSYQTEKLFNFNYHVGKCEGVKSEQDEATGSSHFSCDRCRLPVSTKDALRRHHQTESCAMRAMELTEFFSSPLRNQVRDSSHEKLAASFFAPQEHAVTVKYCSHQTSFYRLLIALAK